MKGVILDRDSFDRNDVDISTLENNGVEWTSYQSSRIEQVGERIEGMDIVITNKVKLTAETISNTNSLKLVLIAATGTDNVDIAACLQQNITVCNARGYTTPAVAQHVFALITALTTSLMKYDSMVKEGQWQKSHVFCLLDHPISELAGKNMGIIGLGTLGQKVADIAAAFDMNVLVSQRPGGELTAGRVPLDTLFKESDIISIHCPLTSHTQNLVGQAEFQQMKSSALIINTARGAIIDSGALIDALNRGEIAGAGIDVLDAEPPSDKHPLIFNQHPNLIVTPHIAWASRESRQRLINQLGDNLNAWKSGTPQNVVML